MQSFEFAVKRRVMIKLFCGLPMIALYLAAAVYTFWFTYGERSYWPT